MYVLAWFIILDLVLMATLCCLTLTKHVTTHGSQQHKPVYTGLPSTDWHVLIKLVVAQVHAKYISRS